MSTDTPITQPPQGDSDKRPALLASAIVLSLIATAFVLLRFGSRRLIRQSPGLDDWFCLAALFFHHMFLADGGVAAFQGGLGRDLTTTVGENPESVVILRLVTEVIYAFSSPLIKLSVLAFYWHIFPTRTVRLGCKIIATLSIIWCIECTITNFVQCRPLKAIWHTELQTLLTTQCFNWPSFYLGTSIINCTIDSLAVALPVYEVVQLHTSRTQKFKICCVFLLGGITCVASMIHAVTLDGVYGADDDGYFTNSRRRGKTNSLFLLLQPWLRSMSPLSARASRCLFPSIVSCDTGIHIKAAKTNCLENRRLGKVILDTGR
ncbi:hypothetical protein BJ166DRAFT_490942 [Pestalotiopsis sp. NC0098]|nr:hypothetical protein BJ166DRAFT_490942 [Pestalotiopsis sp. NC0098]